MRFQTPSFSRDELLSVLPPAELGQLRPPVADVMQLDRRN